MSRGPALIGQLREDHFVNFRPAAAAGPDAWGDRPAMRQLQIKSTSADFHAEYETANERGKQQVVSRWTLGNFTLTCALFEIRLLSGTCFCHNPSQHFEVELAKIRFGHRHRVGLMARVFNGLLNERVQVLRFHPVVTQLRVEAKASAELNNEFNRAIVRLRIGTVCQLEAAGNADPAVKTGLARGAEFHPGNQTERIG